MEDVLSAGTPVEISGQVWDLRPLDFFDLQVLAGDIIAGMTGEELQALKAGKLGVLDGLDRSNPGHMLSLYWLMLRKADPSLSDADRDNCRYRLSKGQVRALFAVGSDNEEAFGKVIAVCGFWPSTEEVETDEKNDDAPETPAQVETPAKPNRSRSKSGTKRPAPSSSSD